MKRNYRRKIRTTGFTLIELMAVMVILGLLAGVVTIGITKQVQKAKEKTTVTQIAQLEQALSAFHLDCGFYPSAIDSLINPASSSRKCKGYTPGGYLSKKEIPSDPWGNGYNFQSPGVNNPDTYDLWSNGADGEEGTSDDIKSWSSTVSGSEE